MSKQPVKAGRYYADNHPKCATCSQKWTHEVTFYGMISEFPIEAHDCIYDNKPETVGFRPKRINPDLDYCRNHSELSYQEVTP